MRVVKNHLGLGVTYIADHNHNENLFCLQTMKVVILILSTLAATLAGPHLFDQRWAINGSGFDDFHDDCPAKRPRWRDASFLKMAVMMTITVFVMMMMVMLMLTQKPYQGDRSRGSPVLWRPDHQLRRMGIHCRFGFEVYFKWVWGNSDHFLLVVVLACF